MFTKYISVLLVWLPAISRCSLIHQPIVRIEMGSKGFHRELEYNVQFDYPLAGKECEYALVQPFSSAVYVSVDQLDGLQRLHKLNAIYPKFVDIEQTTEKAESFSVLLKGAPKITEKIKLPIHFRYHAARETSTSVTVQISTPTMYINCAEKNLDIDSQLDATPNQTYCLNEDECNFSNEEKLSDDCNWKMVKVDYQLTAPLEAEIPVGNSKAYPFVMYVTIVCSWGISLWTIFRTKHIPRRINQKLEEQRILEKKAI